MRRSVTNRAKPLGLKEPESTGFPPPTVDSYATNVTSFSSQYGSESSISYVVTNLSGPVSIFPSYGDYTEVCVFRTYGPWWRHCPSAPPIVKSQPRVTFHATDYVDLTFPRECYPQDLSIYETYNPGAVVRILAANFDPSDKELELPMQQWRWVVLWEGRPGTLAPEATLTTPTLRSCPFRTKLIRLELNHDDLHYYNEMDAVRLRGRYTPYALPGSDVDALADDVEDLTLEQTEEEDKLLQLPSELLHHILRYLDVKTLCRVSLVCGTLRDLAYDPLLYSALSLQPNWHELSDSALSGLAARCSLTEQLDVAWAGPYGVISSQVFVNFVSGLSPTLNHLRLSCCQFVDQDVLTAIGASCPNVTVLDLSSCRAPQGEDFLPLSRLSKLTRLNLYRSLIDGTTLALVLQCNPGLQHINLGSCRNAPASGAAEALAQHCPDLRSLDMWRGKGLTGKALDELSSSCTNLQEIDIGWCNTVQASSGALVNLCRNCPNLVKIFWTSIRTVRDQEMLAIARYCRGAQQVDILGTRDVTQPALTQVLEQCKQLKMVDVSFCHGITNIFVRDMQEKFPNVDIKKSYQDTQS